MTLGTICEKFSPMHHTPAHASNLFSCFFSSTQLHVLFIQVIFKSIIAFCKSYDFTFIWSLSNILKTVFRNEFDKNERHTFDHLLPESDSTFLDFLYWNCDGKRIPARISCWRRHWRKKCLDQGWWITCLVESFSWNMRDCITDSVLLLLQKVSKTEGGWVGDPHEWGPSSPE